MNEFIKLLIRHLLDLLANIHKFRSQLLVLGHGPIMVFVV
jgi:hypothetical protein